MDLVLLSVLGGLVPTLVYVLLVWWLDRYEKEPVWLLVTAFFWGAAPAAILSVVVEFILDLPIAALNAESLTANLISASLTAPVVEEASKCIALVALLLLFRREFDDELDGLVYGAMIGFGFAFTENVFAYFLPMASQGSTQAGLTLVFWRSVVFGVNHAFWAGITGAALGYARLARGWGQRVWVPLGCWCLAVTLHGIHNAGATLAEQWGALCLGVSILVDWGGVLILLLLAALILRRESRWIETGLSDEVQWGALGPAGVLLRSARWRLSARWAAARLGGWNAYRIVGRYFQTATELAFKKQQLRSLGEEGILAEIHRLRNDLASLGAEAAPWLPPGRDTTSQR